MRGEPRDPRSVLSTSLDPAKDKIAVNPPIKDGAATKDNSTKTSKKSGVDASLSSVLFSPDASGLMTKGGKLPALV